MCAKARGVSAWSGCALVVVRAKRGTTAHQAILGDEHSKFLVIRKQCLQHPNMHIPYLWIFKCFRPYWLRFKKSVENFELMTFPE